MDGVKGRVYLLGDQIPLPNRTSTFLQPIVSDAFSTQTFKILLRVVEERKGKR